MPDVHDGNLTAVVLKHDSRLLLRKAELGSTPFFLLSGFFSSRSSRQGEHARTFGAIVYIKKKVQDREEKENRHCCDHMPGLFFYGGPLEADEKLLPMEQISSCMQTCAQACGQTCAHAHAHRIAHRHARQHV